MVGGVAIAQALLISFWLGATVLRARLAETPNVYSMIALEEIMLEPF